jgi:hypothetical protein
MTTFPTAIRFARLGLAASLLCAGLLVASAQSALAGEVSPVPVSAPQTLDAGRSSSGSASLTATPVPDTTHIIAPVGFGWG